MRILKCSAIVWSLMLAPLGMAAVRAAEPANGDSSEVAEQDTGYYQTALQAAPQQAQDGTMQEALPEQPAAPGQYYYQRGPYPPAGMPDEAMPWPGVSPYSNNFDQLRREQGLWMNQTSNAPRKWHMGIDYLRMMLKGPGNHQVGFPVPEGDPNLLSGFIPQLNDWSRGINTNGIKPFVGYTNADDSGLEIEGFYLQNMHVGSFFPSLAYPGMINMIDAVPRTISQPTVLNPASPLAIEPVGTITALPMTFNESINATYTSNAWGVQANALTTPILGHGANKLRFMYGARYLGVKESLDLQMMDSVSGFSEITSGVTSQLFGPQVGLQWDLGGKNFKISSFVKAGAMGDFAVTNLRALNYGVNSNLLLSDPTFPQPGANVLLKEHHSHISPLIDLGVQMEIPLFSYLPLVNRVPILRRGQFRFGYQFLALFLMSRPADVINYTYPAPSIDYQPSTFYLRGFNVGIDWKW